MNFRLIFVLVFAILLMPTTSFGQTSDEIPVGSGKYDGVFTIQNVKMVENDTYKMISMDVTIKVKNLESKDVYWHSTSSITLVNENGKTYRVPFGGCGGTPESLVIYPNRGGEGTYTTCFKVDKEFSNFKIQYQNNILKKSYEIGNLDLNQINQQTVQTTEKSPIDTVIETKIPNTSKPKDFFSQILDMLKKLFSFS